MTKDDLAAETCPRRLHQIKVKSVVNISLVHPVKVHRRIMENLRARPTNGVIYGVTIKKSALLLLKLAQTNASKQQFILGHRKEAVLDVWHSWIFFSGGFVRVTRFFKVLVFGVTNFERYHLDDFLYQIDRLDCDISFLAKFSLVFI